MIRSRCCYQYTRHCVPYLSEVQETYRAAARAVTRMASGPLSLSENVSHQSVKLQVLKASTDS